VAPFSVEAMGRSVVLTGRFDARDRARLRRRLDGEPLSEGEPYAELEAALMGMRLGARDQASLARLDLDDFLHRTGRIALAPAERLRHLAIFLEEEVRADYGAVIDRVYEAALRLSPQDSYVWHSRGISAKEPALDSSDEAVVARWSSRALRYLHRARELAPDDAQVAYSLGKWHYLFGQLEEASTWFERTLAIDAEHGWALLYRAHCLHDAERWAEAVEAYAAVPLEAFHGPRAWRVDMILEAQGYCRLMAGDREGAVVDLSRLMERLDTEPHRAEPLLLKWLGKACLAALEPELGARYRALVGKLERPP